MKTIYELLNEVKSYGERLEELKKIVPEIEKGEKIYYDGDKYIYILNNSLYSGMDRYVKDNKVSGCFPFIFLLEALYLGKDFAKKYNSISDLKLNKSLSLNEYGLVESKIFGTVGNKYTIRELFE